MNNKYLPRLLDLSNKSFLLFGPRGTGKSTLLKQKLKKAYSINLLQSSNYIPLLQNPSLLKEWIAHLKSGDWVIIDEIQKLPNLMDEVHAIYEEKRLHFALTGSSARKLKRGGANLLAGRALQLYLFPLVYKEYKKMISIEEAIDWGSLPGVVTDKKNRAETLSTYVETYLKQEPLEEGLIRKLEPFVRFLKISGQYNAQILNIENIARECHIGRTTVDKYFEILEDTLLSFRLPAISLGLKTKETFHPKFYFFDSGVARACAGLIYEDVDSVWRGFAFETNIINEVKAYNFYKKKQRELYYYKVSNGLEIDLIIETRKKTLSKTQELIAIEIKNTKTWDRRWTKNLELLSAESKKIKKMVGIYRGDKILTQGNTVIYPFIDFIEKLYAGDFF